MRLISNMCTLSKFFSFYLIIKQFITCVFSIMVYFYDKMTWKMVRFLSGIPYPSSRSLSSMSIDYIWQMLWQVSRDSSSKGNPCWHGWSLYWLKGARHKRFASWESKMFLSDPNVLCSSMNLFMAYFRSSYILLLSHPQEVLCFWVVMPCWTSIYEPGILSV